MKSRGNTYQGCVGALFPAMNSRALRLTLHTITAAAFAAGITIPALTHDAPLGGWVGPLFTVPADISPKWQTDYATEFPGCSPAQPSKPGPLVVVDQDAKPHRMTFASAWERGHNTNHADDVWVVGWCR